MYIFLTLLAFYVFSVFIFWLYMQLSYYNPRGRQYYEQPEGPPAADIVIMFIPAINFIIIFIFWIIHFPVKVKLPKIKFPKIKIKPEKFFIRKKPQSLPWQYPNYSIQPRYNREDHLGRVNPIPGAFNHPNRFDNAYDRLVNGRLYNRDDLFSAIQNIPRLVTNDEEDLIIEKPKPFKISKKKKI